MAVLSEELIYEILSVVEEIPEGKVASYGQIAEMIGRKKNSRLVGKVLSMSEFYGEYPCHRVVNHAGRLAPFFHEQRGLLLQEGVIFKENGYVDMKECKWGENAEVESIKYLNVEDYLKNITKLDS